MSPFRVGSPANITTLRAQAHLHQPNYGTRHANRVSLAGKDSALASRDLVPRLTPPARRRDIETSFLVVAADLRSVDYQDANLVQPSPAMGSRHPSAGLSNDESSEGGSRSPSPETTSPQLLNRRLSRLPSDPGHAPPTPPKTVPLDAAEFDADPPSRTLSVDQHGSPRISPVASTSANPFDPRRPWVPSESHVASSPPPRRRRTSESSVEPAAAFIPYVRRPKPRERSPDRGRHRPTGVAEVPNLIGALHANAFKLKDEAGQLGIFFVLPDLSVRTEGEFRLRLRLTSLGTLGAGLRTDSTSPIVASVYTQAFSVTSAKRFAGQLDPTALSKCFARQGVRIPVRRATKSRSRTAVTSP